MRATRPAAARRTQTDEAETELQQRTRDSESKAEEIAELQRKIAEYRERLKTRPAELDAQQAVRLGPLHEECRRLEEALERELNASRTAREGEAAEGQAEAEALTLEDEGF